MPITSVYDVPAMHATYSPLDEMHAASDAVLATLDDAYATLDDVDATMHPLDDMDAFPDDRIVDAVDEKFDIAMDRKGAVDKVSKKQGDKEKRKRNCTNHRRPQLGRAVCVCISHML